MSEADASSTDPDDPAETIAALAADLEQLSRIVTSLTTTTSTTPSATPQLEPPPRPWCWPKMPHPRKADRLGELGDWLTQVLFGWPAAQRAIQPCWPRHWDVIEEISMLYCTWKTAYLWEGATASDAAEYLDRWLPNALDRIEIRLRPCGQTHQPDGPRRDDTAILAAVQDELRWL
uniref:hypothetical protein n=1 Tax=Nonomuraea sp. CA-252377 TaxID=3240003 RepID=UPI003F490C8E